MGRNYRPNLRDAGAAHPEMGQALDRLLCAGGGSGIEVAGYGCGATRSTSFPR